MKRFKPILFIIIFGLLIVISVLLTEENVHEIPADVTVYLSETSLGDVSSLWVEETSSAVVTEPENTTLAQAEATTVIETVITDAATQEVTASLTVSPVTVEATTVGRENTSEDVTLNVELPSANGEIYVDTNPANAFIEIVVNQRGIEAERLVAVYSLPDTGQNYVLEFDENTTERNADTLVRVFLIDTQGSISSVCSADSELCENVTGVENWFCMNVILKRMVLPAIADRLK